MTKCSIFSLWLPRGKIAKFHAKFLLMTWMLGFPAPRRLDIVLYANYGNMEI